MDFGQHTAEQLDRNLAQRKSVREKADSGQYEKLQAHKAKAKKVEQLYTSNEDKSQ